MQHMGPFLGNLGRERPTPCIEPTAPCWLAIGYLPTLLCKLVCWLAKQDLDDARALLDNLLPDNCSDPTGGGGLLAIIPELPTVNTPLENEGGLAIHGVKPLEGYGRMFHGAYRERPIGLYGARVCNVTGGFSPCPKQHLNLGDVGHSEAGTDGKMSIV
ncbi:hypothetical protein SCAR479_13171 [Seiridium cardinale]|uniref:Uncharacterized protein n=1 Tax=Seiridium cardinale TaxID=138064 RepID=A0ABR2X8R7_9PEZI